MISKNKELKEKLQRLLQELSAPFSYNDPWWGAQELDMIRTHAAREIAECVNLLDAANAEEDKK